MARKSRRDPESFDEDDMPCVCPICDGWVDLTDSVDDPMRPGNLCCPDCARERRQELKDEEE